MSGAERQETLNIKKIEQPKKKYIYRIHNSVSV